MIQRRDESAPLGLVAHKAGLGLPQGPHGPVNSAPERPKAQGMLTRTPHGPVDSGLVRRKARSILALCATRPRYFCRVSALVRHKGEPLGAPTALHGCR